MQRLRKFPSQLFLIAKTTAVTFDTHYRP